jgi:scyllo-inositol 2-dehydrogenase (NADP+)
MVTVALVGFGLSGRYLQAPFFDVNPNFKLKTVVTNNQNPQDIFPSVQKVSTLQEVLADAEIDLVSICSPNATHYEYTKLCLLAGKHVLVEKPFAPTFIEAQELIEIAKTQGKHLFVFQNRRFDSDFMTVKKVIESGVLGNIHTYQAHWNRYKPVLNPKKWKEEIAPASGIIYDLGSHLIDQTILLLGESFSPENPEVAYLQKQGQTFTQRENSTIDDAFTIWLDFNDIKITLTGSLMVLGELPRYVVHGSKGSFIKYGMDVQEDHAKAGILPNDPSFGIEPPQYFGTLTTEINGLAVQKRVETERGKWAILFQNIYEVIAQNKQPLINNEDVLTQIKIIETAKNELRLLGKEY